MNGLVTVERPMEVMVDSRISRLGRAYVAMSRYPTVAEFDRLLDILVLQRNTYAEFESDERKEAAKTGV